MSATNTQHQRPARRQNTSGQELHRELVLRGVSCLHRPAMHCQAWEGRRAGGKGGPDPEPKARHMGLFLCHTCEHPNGAPK